MQQNYDEIYTMIRQGGPISFIALDQIYRSDTDNIYNQFNLIYDDFTRASSQKQFKVNQVQNVIDKEVLEGAEENYSDKLDNFVSEYSEQINEEEEQQYEHEQDYQYDITKANPEALELELQGFGDDSEEEGQSQQLQQLTEYQQKQAQLQLLIRQLEGEIVQQKSWKFSGETTAKDRKQNELLDDLPEFNVRQRAKLQITEELNNQIEEILKLRIKDKIFNNPVFKVVEEVEKELKHVNTEKATVGLGDTLGEEIIGQGIQLTDAIRTKREECEHRYRELETELRSYFIGARLM